MNKLCASFPVARRAALLTLLLAPAVLTAQTTAPPAAWPERKPKLVVAVVVDQFRYDYLMRFRADYNGGFARLLSQGAVWTNAHHEHFPTVTAIGHTTVLTGSTPSVSGIVGNTWFDRQTGKQVTSVSDSSRQLLGGTPGKQASSPHRLLISTVGDELKMATRGKAKTIGISLKDRGAILPVGRMADAAYWFDAASGNFVSSTWYFEKVPDWVTQFNQSRPGDKYLGQTWMPFDSKDAAAKPYYTGSKEANSLFYESLTATPYGNELVERFAEEAVSQEKLGQRDTTDLLSVSFSSNDYVGHELGPDAPQVRDIAVQTDRTIGRFLAFLDQTVGAGQYVLVMTADHGVAPLPETMGQRKMPGGRMTEQSVLAAAQSGIVAKFGEGNWILGHSGPAPYFNHELIRQKGLSQTDVENAAAEAVRATPHIFRVYTRSQFVRAALLEDLVDRRVRNGFHIERAADLFIVADPYWLFEQRGTSHGTPFNYDSHVPVIFMGPGIKAGKYYTHIATYDIAPTLSSILDIEAPSGSVGRVLTEMIQ